LPCWIVPSFARQNWHGYSPGGACHLFTGVRLRQAATLRRAHWRTRELVARRPVPAAVL